MADPKPLRAEQIDQLIEVAARHPKLQDPILPIAFWEEAAFAEGTIFNDDEARLATRPWNRMAVATAGVPLDDPGDCGGLRVTRYTVAPLAAQRGYVRIPNRSALFFEAVIPPGKVVRRVLTIWQRNGWVVAAENGYALRNGPTRSELEGCRARLVYGLAMAREYWWEAVFRPERSAPFVVPTTARGSLALFRLRDKPDDAIRRPALRHWVAEHSRLTPSGDSIGVRSHLRGITSFTWSGMHVTLRPSRFDLERAESR